MARIHFCAAPSTSSRFRIVTWGTRMSSGTVGATGEPDECGPFRIQTDDPRRLGPDRPVPSPSDEKSAIYITLPMRSHVTGRVEAMVAHRPPHRSRRAAFPHRARPSGYPITPLGSASCARGVAVVADGARGSRRSGPKGASVAGRGDGAPIATTAQWPCGNERCRPRCR